jgi:transcriptional regulator with GAF, ATPase, and Fis domain
MLRPVSYVDHPTESLGTPKDRGARPARARLRPVAPPGVRWGIELSATPCTIGRAPEDGTPPLLHGTVSRRHATVYWDPDRQAHLVEDLGSRHGTQVDGMAAGTGVALHDGAILRLGGAFLAYERASDLEVVDPVEVSREAVPGEAPPTAALRAQVARCAADPSPVLITGPTGTGKEWVAGELHRLSARRGPLVAVNCAALAPQLVESQLFGHVRGAFTGATESSDGLFRAAHGGTLLLDEIGELPLELQPKLLRVLQDGQVQPVGGTRAVTIEVRVIAATNRDVPSLVDSGRFRRDLHARLAKWEVAVPPLTARRGDLPMWVERLWRSWCAARGVERALPPLTAAAWAAVLDHPWPDNLRGIDRLVHELAARPVSDEPVERAELPPWLRDPASPSPASTPAVAPLAAAPPRPAEPAGRPPVPTREEFEAAWRELGGNIRGLARRYDRDRRQIYRWAEAYGLREGGTPDET